MQSEEELNLVSQKDYFYYPGITPWDVKEIPEGVDLCLLNAEDHMR